MFEELKRLAEEAEAKGVELRAEFNAAVLGHKSPAAIKAEVEKAQAVKPADEAAKAEAAKVEAARIAAASVRP